MVPSINEYRPIGLQAMAAVMTKHRKVVHQIPADLATEHFLKWGISTDDHDASDTKRRLAKVRPELSIEEQVWYLMTAESIADAEKAKRVWNPKANVNKYRHLCKTATRAARLILAIDELVPSPWVDERSYIGEIVAGLNSVMQGILQATMLPSKNTSVGRATTILQQTKSLFSKRTSRMHWELLQDLVWLASGKRIRPSERTVRRYLDEPRRSRSPVRDYWARNWDLLRRAGLLASPSRSDTIEAVAEDATQYLERPKSPPTPRKKAVQGKKSAEKRC
jgi:hypothetical protein